MNGEEMIKELETAIKANAKSASKTDIKADDALKYTQACCNAANAIATLMIKHD